MIPFTTHTGKAAFLDRMDVDTDQIIPKQFLKRVERTGFGEFLFYDWRFKDDGTDNPEFSLNRPEAKGASILIARRNFGCGSSREHAPWALGDYGFRVLIAPTYADIFRNNCYKNGILSIALSEEKVNDLFAKGPELELNVDLPRQIVSVVGGDWIADFEIEPFQKDCLINGWDDIGLSLRHEGEITRFEGEHKTWLSVPSEA